MRVNELKDLLRRFRVVYEKMVKVDEYVSEVAEENCESIIIPSLKESK